MDNLCLVLGHQWVFRHLWINSGMFFFEKECLRCGDKCSLYESPNSTSYTGYMFIVGQYSYGSVSDSKK